MRFLANHGGWRRFCVIFVCLLIFFFALQSRLELYGHGFDTQIHPCNSSKLCIDASTSRTFVPAVIVVDWFVAAVTYCLLLHGERLEQRVFGSLVSHDLKLHYQRRFLRPPPASSF